MLVSGIISCFCSFAPIAFAQESASSNKELNQETDYAPSVLLSISPMKEKLDEEHLLKKPSAKEKKLIAQVPNKAIDNFGLSSRAFQLVEIWGLAPTFDTLLKHRKPIPTSEIEKTLKRLVARQEVNELVLEKLFDVRKTLNTIDSQMAIAQEIRAKLTTKRDKAIRFNTYSDIVAGGITGILSGALRVATLDFVAPDVVDIGEGMMEMGLAGWALRTENVQHRMEAGVPNLLGKTIFPDHNHPNKFPESVWKYLNSVPVDSKTKLTRREELVRRWTTSHYCFIHKGHKKFKYDRVRHISGTQNGKPYLTIALLEDRIAMLEDLRTEVTLMEDLIAEIYQTSRRF